MSLRDPNNPYPVDSNEWVTQNERYANKVRGAVSPPMESRTTWWSSVWYRWANWSQAQRSARSKRRLGALPTRKLRTIPRDR